MNLHTLQRIIKLILFLFAAANISLIYNSQRNEHLPIQDGQRNLP
jgi:hypothetical protein